MSDEDLRKQGRFTVRWFAEIDSTNRYLLDAARAGAPHGLVAVADHQTNGRGRLGRTWVDDAAQSLLASVCVRLPMRVEAAHRYTTAVAVALAEGVDAVTGVRPFHKWPNDLVVDDRKLAGVLAEADVAADGSVRALVVGAGTNVTSVPDAFATDAISCEDLRGAPVDREALLRAWLDALGPLLDDPSQACERAREHSATLTRRVRVELVNETFEGVAAHLTDDGALVVRADSGTDRVVTAGDVVHLRPTT